MMTERLFT